MLRTVVTIAASYFFISLFQGILYSLTHGRFTALVLRLTLQHKLQWAQYPLSGFWLTDSWSPQYSQPYIPQEYRSPLQSKNFHFKCQYIHCHNPVLFLCICISTSFTLVWETFSCRVDLFCMLSPLTLEDHFGMIKQYSVCVIAAEFTSDMFMTSFLPHPVFSFIPHAPCKLLSCQPGDKKKSQHKYSTYT